MKKLVVANWKLNPATLKEAQELSSQIERGSKNQVVVCPPHLYLAAIDFPVLGAQDCFWEDKGAHTGQVSPLQLKNLKVKYCIVGHSEKRGVGENDVQINFKIHALLNQKITPVLCVGHGTTAEEDDLEVVDVLKSQMEQDLKGIDASKVVVAYEPVWAIGSGKTPTPEHAEQICLFLKTRFGISKALYGGSVTVFNAQSFLEQEHVGGLLVGGESLSLKHFNRIINF